MLDSTYGEIIYNYYAWGAKPDGSYFEERKEIPQRNCTRVELKLDDDYDGPSETTFLPIHKEHRDWLELYYQKLLCLNKEDLWIHGDFNSANARQINVQLRKCRGRPDCKSDEQILEYFSGKYLLILHN